MAAQSSDVFSFQLKGPIRQISTASLFSHCEAWKQCLALPLQRSSSAWQTGRMSHVWCLQAASLSARITCVGFGGSASPTDLVFSRSSTRQRWRRASAPGKGWEIPLPPPVSDEGADVALLPVLSPHLLGEVLVASEGGAAVLWTVGRGLVHSLLGRHVQPVELSVI